MKYMWTLKHIIIKFCILTFVESREKLTDLKTQIQVGQIIDKTLNITIILYFDVIIFAIYKRHFFNKHKIIE